MFDDRDTDTKHIDLIARIQRRDVAAFEQLYDNCSRLVFSFAYRIVREQVLAEELAQDVFLKVWRDAAHYDPDRGSVRAWLVVITRTRALDQLRLLRRRADGLSNWQSAATVRVADDVRHETIEDGQRAAASAVMEVLPAEDQNLMKLAFKEGLTHQEIAARLRQPLGTVKTRLRRSLKLVRAAIASPRSRPFTWLSWPQLPAACPGACALENVRIVAVDDDDDTLRLLTLVLERAGATVTPAGSAAQAFRRVSTAVPDILLTDIEMPGEDGYRLLGRVRRLASEGAKNLPAVAFTAHGTADDRHRAAAAGFALHIPKPIQPDLLVTRVAALVRPTSTPERAVG